MQHEQWELAYQAAMDKLPLPAVVVNEDDPLPGEATAAASSAIPESGLEREALAFVGGEWSTSVDTSATTSASPRHQRQLRRPSRVAGCTPSAAGASTSRAPGGWRWLRLSTRSFAR